MEHKKEFMDPLHVAWIKDHKIPIPVDVCLRKYPWAQFVPNEENWFASTLRCGVCSKWSDYFKLNKNYRTDMSIGKGIHKNTRAQYLTALANHAKSAQHQLVIKKLESRTLEDIKEDDYQFSLGENFNDGAFLGINTLYYIIAFTN